MIDRYCTAEMSAIWGRHAKYQKWLEVELAICDAYAEEGIIPTEAHDLITNNAGFDITRCDELEQVTQHDLMAFVQCLSERVGDAGKYIHMGVTSYDVIDTSLGMMLRDSCGVLLLSGQRLQEVLLTMAKKYEKTSMIGRTHGVHAEPITFGYKVFSWAKELERNLQRLKQIQKEVSVGKISGAVGVHAFVSPELETRICNKLGLEPDPVSTQIVCRDRMAQFMNTLALLGAGLERITTELRNLQRTEILEVQEGFSKGQTGSSAMPHKRNPWRSETVGGLARILRSNAHAMLESVSTWHERDLTNSSVERIVLPDSCHLADFMVNRVRQILENLEVLPANMKKNLNAMGDLVFSEHLMIALVKAGMKREVAYKLAQSLATKAWKGENYQELVRADDKVQALLSPAEIDNIFDLNHHLRHIKIENN